MKLAPKATENLKTAFQLCIPLEEPPKRDPSNGEKPISFVCSREPGNKDAAPYQIKAYPFEDGDNCEQFIKTKKLFDDIIKGQEIETNANLVTLVRQLFKGSALTAFENEIPIDPTAVIEDDMYVKAWRSMTAAVFPAKAARNQKKAMKRIRKPIDMSFRAFANRMKRLNEYLAHFPKHANGRSIKPMPDDEFLELLHDALPRNGYQDVMQQHDYDPTTAKDLQEFIEWIERRCEPFDKKEPRNVMDQKIPKKKRGRKSDNEQQQPTSKKQRNEKFCLIHGHCSHTSEQCDRLKELAKAEKVERAAKQERYKSKNKDDKRNNKPKDFHLGERGFDESELTRVVAKTCTKLFKEFKRGFEESKAPMVDDMGDDENQAYMRKLNRDESDSSSDEE